MADPTAFPVWLLPANAGGQPALVNDLVSYRAALTQGFTFDTVTPAVTVNPTAAGTGSGGPTTPSSAATSTAAAVVIIAAPISSQQTTNDGKGRNKK